MAGLSVEVREALWRGSCRDRLGVAREVACWMIAACSKRALAANKWMFFGLVVGYGRHTSRFSGPR